MIRYTTVPLPRLQALNARTMHEALQQSAQATLHADVDAGPLVALRASREDRRAVSVEAVVGHAVVSALVAHPQLNARVGVEGLTVYHAINLGLMVAMEKGVIVPAVEEAEALTLDQLEAAMRDVVTRAEAGELSLNDTRRTTFTLASFADYGVDHMTPILVSSMVATLGVGRVRAVCEPGPEGCRPGHRIALSLTFDHRAVHGIEAARFLGKIAERLADPGRP